MSVTLQAHTVQQQEHNHIYRFIVRPARELTGARCGADTLWLSWWRPAILSACNMAHTRAARYLRKRVRNIQRRLTPCCVCSHELEYGSHANAPYDLTGRKGLIVSSGDKIENGTALTANSLDSEQLLASLVSNYVKDVIFKAKVRLYIEDMIIKGALGVLDGSIRDSGGRMS